MSMQESTTNLETAATAYRAEFLALLEKLGRGQFDPDAIQKAIDDATADAIAYILSQINGMDLVTLAANVETQRRVLEIDYSCDPLDKYFFEFFSAPYTYTDFAVIPGVKSVVGDDSMDCASTDSLAVGSEYVVTAAGGVSFVVTIKEILSSTRFIITEPATTTVGNATLRRTTWTAGNGLSSAVSGGVYYSSKLNLDTKIGARKAVVIRRSVGAADLTVYYKTKFMANWAEAPWKWRRTPPMGFSGTREDAYEDVEYTFDVTGDFYLKVVAHSSVEVRFILGVSRDTALKGTGRVPVAPVNLSPSSAQVGIGPTPTLQASAYAHPAYLLQAGAQFQISRSSSDFGAGYLTMDSGLVGAVTSLALNASVLSANTSYYWRVRFQDAEGNFSEWSIPTMFTTKTLFDAQHVSTPAITSPLNNASGLGHTPTIVGTAFSATGEIATHKSSELEISKDIAFTEVVYSKTLSTKTGDPNLTTFVVPAGSSLIDGTYYARIRYQALYPYSHEDPPGIDVILDSEWSGAVSFTVVTVVPFVSVLHGSYPNLLNGAVYDPTTGGIVVVGSESNGTSGASLNACIVRMASGGSVSWQKNLGGTGIDGFNDVVRDSSGNLFAAGSENTTRGNLDSLVAKYASDGTLTWQKSLGGTLDQTFKKLALCPDGGVVAVGIQTVTSENVNAIIAKFSAAGELVWQKRLDGSYDDQFKSVAVDADGNIYAVGWENSSSGKGNYAALIVKYNQSGAVVWQKRLYTSAHMQFEGVGIDSSGNVYAIGAEAVSRSGTNYSGLVVKFDTSGSILWQRSLKPTTGDVFFRCGAVSSDGVVFACGDEWATSPSNIIIAKYLPNGTLEWQRILDTAGQEYGLGIAQGMSHDVFIVGSGNGYSSGSRSDSYVLHIPSDADGFIGAVSGIPQIAFVETSHQDLNTSSLMTLNPTTLAEDSPGLTIGSPTLSTGNPGLSAHTVAM